MQQQGSESSPVTGYDPRTSTSHALTEVRTVLKRARTAQKTIGAPGITPTDTTPAAYNGYLDHEGPDLDKMRAALDEVIALLQPWERVSRR